MRETLPTHPLRPDVLRRGGLTLGLTRGGLTRGIIAGGIVFGALLATPAIADEISGTSWQSGRFEFGPRVTHISLRDTETEATLPMGGLGAYMRYRITRRWGAEATIDAVMADELTSQSPGEVSRVTAPATLSAMFYLWPDDATQFYILAGVGSADHEIDYAALGETHTYTTRVSTFGFGVQYRTESIRYDASLRILNFARPDAESVEVTALSAGRPQSGNYAAHSQDRSISGAMFTLGVHWGW